MENHFDKISSFKEKFFWGHIYEVLKVYDFSFGYFLVHKTPDNLNEVFWATNSLEDLNKGLNIIKQDFPNFTFRHGKNYSSLLVETKKHLLIVTCNI